MRLFFSGWGHKNVEFDERVSTLGTRYRLLSCHGDYLRPAHHFSRALHTLQQPFEIMYDSGAFTAWSKGKEITLDELIAVYDEMIAKYESGAQAIWLISLDKIPGSPGRTATPDEIDEACRISDENFAVLQKRYGKRVLPVFHQNESAQRLRDVAAMADYICVSPRNDLPERSRRRWAMEAHADIPGKNTHGLATTGFSMMSQVPWGSVDSATWIWLAMNGAVFYSKTLRGLQLSSKSVTLKDTGKHYRTLSTVEQQAFTESVERRGFTIHELEDNFYHRIIFNRVIMTETYTTLPTPAQIAHNVPVEQSLFGL